VERSHAARARVFWQIRAPRVRPPATRTRSCALDRRDGWGSLGIRPGRTLGDGLWGTWVREVQRVARAKDRLRVAYSQEFCLLEPFQVRKVLQECASRTPNVRDDIQPSHIYNDASEAGRRISRNWSAWHESLSVTSWAFQTVLSLLIPARGYIAGGWERLRRSKRLRKTAHVPMQVLVAKALRRMNQNIVHARFMRRAKTESRGGSNTRARQNPWLESGGATLYF
jgi:hypothetical protein